MANCTLLLTTGDQFLQTSGDLLTLTSDCSAEPVTPTRFIAWTEQTTATWQEHTRTAWVEHTHATYQEGN